MDLYSNGCKMNWLEFFFGIEYTGCCMVSCSSGF